MDAPQRPVFRRVRSQADLSKASTTDLSGASRCFRPWTSAGSGSAAAKAEMIQLTRVIALQYARRAYGPRRDQAGLPEIKEHKTTVVHKVDRKELVASIATMIGRLRIPLDPSKLLPQPVVVREENIYKPNILTRKNN